APLAAASIAASGLKTLPSEDFQFGVRWDRRYSYGADVTYAPSDRLTLFADVGYEHFTLQDAGRPNNPNQITDPYTLGGTLITNPDWVNTPRNNYPTAGAGFETQIVPDRLSFKIHYAFAKSDGVEVFTNPILPFQGTAGGPFIPANYNAVDSSKL